MSWVRCSPNSQLFQAEQSSISHLKATSHFCHTPLRDSEQSFSNFQSVGESSRAHQLLDLSDSIRGRVFGDLRSGNRRPTSVLLFYELPIKIPVINTNAPPNPTCRAADGMGVSM